MWFYRHTQPQRLKHHQTVRFFWKSVVLWTSLLWRVLNSTEAPAGTISLQCFPQITSLPGEQREHQGLGVAGVRMCLVWATAPVPRSAARALELDGTLAGQAL